jgi:DMSO/TMAO reductase YedYZ molybdopterin-dependent catalytic subunit
MSGGLLDRIPVPAPGAGAGRRVAAWREERLADPRHSDRVAAVLGIALGVCFFVCFGTGLLSHAIQHPPSWFHWWPRPAGSFRITQGVHVATGIAAVPLLFAKLWSVFPRLFQWPLATDVLHAVERLSLLPLVGGALFMLVTGIANIELWYPWPFFFPAGHYAVSFVVIGALVIHIGAKLTITRQALRRQLSDPGASPQAVAAAAASTQGRRRFLGFAGAASAVLVVTTIGQTVSPLRRLALLAPRHPDLGVQGFPVNKTAIEAGVVKSIADAGYSVQVRRNGAVLRSFSIAELTAMPQHDATLPIACVEGWSASKRWTGVSVRSVLAAAGITDGHSVTVGSRQRGGRYRASLVDHSQLDDEDTLLALMVEGETLAPDHGFPVRLIGPGRSGVLQTKWVATLDVG